MQYFLDLSFVDGLVLASLAISIPGIVTVYLVRFAIRNELTKQHERVGRLLFRVLASLLALLISLSYANESIRYNKVSDSLQQEASIIASLGIKINAYRTNSATEIKKALRDYLRYTIEDNWEHVVDDPYKTRMMGRIVYMNNVARTMETTKAYQEPLKNEIVADIDMLTKTMQVRFFSTNTRLPFLTYITALGLLISWCFFAVYRLDFISVSFLTLYNIFIAVMIYFIIMLGNPLTGPLKVDPEPFIILDELGLDRIP